MRAVFLFFTTLTILLSNSWGVEFQVNKKQKNLVKFISHAPMEDFEGVTDKIDGYVIWEVEGPLDQSEFYFEVDLNSLDTGIGLRNRHMRDNYLHTDEHPFAIYAGKLIQIEKKNDLNLEFTTQGTITIHGVDRPLAANGSASMDGQTAHVQIHFPINLTDFNIKIPKLMFMKVNENIQLELDFYLRKMSD